MTRTLVAGPAAAAECQRPRRFRSVGSKYFRSARCAAGEDALPHTARVWSSHRGRETLHRAERGKGRIDAVAPRGDDHHRRCLRSVSVRGRCVCVCEMFRGSVSPGFHAPAYDAPNGRTRATCCRKHLGPRQNGASCWPAPAAAHIALLRARSARISWPSQAAPPTEGSIRQLACSANVRERREHVCSREKEAEVLARYWAQCLFQVYVAQKRIRFARQAITLMVCAGNAGRSSGSV